MTTVYLSLGTNMGDRMAYLQGAVSALGQLPQTQVTKVSSVYETAAWGYTDQADFLNIACQLETDLTSQELLLSCQEIEKQLDRVRHEHWGPRTIDIDVLLFGQEIIDVENLKVPHSFMTQRGFVLVPLSELASDVIVPGSGETVCQHLAKLDTSDVVFAHPSDSLLKK